MTGYAVSFNRRHRRHGHLFQNRYKSILCQEDVYLKELIRLGDSDFVESVLAAADEQMERKYALQAAGLNLDGLAEIVAGLTGVKPSRIFSPGKDRSRVYARSLLCFWANRELGVSLAELSRRIRISQSSISMSVQRGEQIVEKEGHSLLNQLKLKNRRASP